MKIISNLTFLEGYFTSPNLSNIVMLVYYLRGEIQLAWTGGDWSDCPWPPLTLTNPPSLQVIAADGEQKAARALKEASETIAESSSAMQLRYLQVRL